MITPIPQAQPQALAGLRIIEVAGPATAYCGKLFADMGAEVWLVEAPGGATGRRQGPFFDGESGDEASMSFAYQNAGKHSIVLDLGQAKDRDTFLRMSASADVVLEAEKPGVMPARGLGYDELSAGHADLVMTSITPFGQSGPYAQYEAEDLIALALGGFLYLGGYPDSPPMAAYGFQAYLAAAQLAAVATLMATTAVDAGGPGSWVDVSMQESVVLALENAVQFYDLEKKVRKRHAGDQRQAGMGVFPCRDGQVYFMAGGIASNRFWHASVQWLMDEHAPGADQLLQPRWLDMAFLVTPEAKRLFASVFEPFAARFTKAELYAAGQARRLPICPVSTPADLVDNRQLAARRHFVTLPHRASGRSVVVPGAPYVLGETPWRIAGDAPRAGGSTDAILAALDADAPRRRHA